MVGVLEMIRSSDRCGGIDAGEPKNGKGELESPSHFVKRPGIRYKSIKNVLVGIWKLYDSSAETSLKEVYD
jgi:hypothetical protein